MLGPHARTDRTRDTRVAEPWLPAPEDGRPREGQRLTPDAPHNGGRPPPRGRTSHHPRGAQPPQGMQAKGTVLGPHTHTPAPTARGWQTPTARPAGGQSGEGQRLTSDAPHNGGRHPPRERPSATPTASNAGPQGGTLWGRCWVPTPAPTAPGTHGCRTPAARPRGGAAWRGTAPDTRRPSQRWQATPPGDSPPPPPRHAAPTGHAGQGDSVGPPHPHARADSTFVAAVGGALQHAIVMRYMLEADQTEQGATAATWDTQEEWLQRGIPLWVLDSKRGHEGHQQVHAAEAVQQDVVTEAPAEDTEPGAPAPTLPMQAKMKKTAKVVPTQGTAAGKGTPSSTKKQAKGKEKESDKPAESDDDDTDEESEEDDLEQVLETQQKRKRASASHFDASSPDSGKEQSKKKAKTAASATAEFKPPSRSGTLPSRGTVASPSGTSTTARSLGSRLAKVAGPKKK